MTYSRVNNRVWQAVVSNSVFHALARQCHNQAPSHKHTPPLLTLKLFDKRRSHTRLSIYSNNKSWPTWSFNRTFKKTRDALKQVFTIQLDTAFQSWLNWGLVWLLTRWNTGYCWFSSRCLFTLYLRPLIKMCFTLCPCCAASSCTSWDPRPYWHRGEVSVARSRRTLNS